MERQRNGLTSYFFSSTCCLVFPQKHYYLAICLKFQKSHNGHTFTTRRTLDNWKSDQSFAGIMQLHIRQINTFSLQNSFLLFSQFTTTNNTIIHWFRLIIIEAKRDAFPPLQLQIQLTQLCRYFMVFHCPLPLCTCPR